MLRGPLRDLFGGAHLLPFFDPIDGADAGFDPSDHGVVDPRLGTWADVDSLSQQVDIMADLIVNHVSAQSPQFRDFCQNGRRSEHAGMFLTLDRVFPTGVKEADLLRIYRPRPGLPFTALELGDGSKRLMWTTFTDQQIDIDVTKPQGRSYISDILKVFSKSGVSMIRLDAAGYAIKKPGTSCFMLPETIEFIKDVTGEAHELGIEVLVELHAHHQEQIDIAKHVDRVYDFALPPLVLHALLFGTSKSLKHWLTISPRNAITVLDTHDGIGVIDIGSSSDGSLPGLVEPAELDALVEKVHENSQGQSRQATGAAASNLDLYQINCTYYDALCRDDRQYLIARAIQFFCPGVPQVYYAGLLAMANDMELLGRTKVGRDINRPYLGRAEVDRALHRPVVQDLLRLIRFRNSHPAFGGTFSLGDSPNTAIVLTWSNDSDFAELRVDLKSKKVQLTHAEEGKKHVFDVFASLDGKPLGGAGSTPAGGASSTSGSAAGSVESVNTAPVNAAPVNTAPVNTAPVNAAPIDTAPADAEPTVS